MSLGHELLDRVLTRLGLSARPTVDRAGLDRLYAAWCLWVPFDNTRKLLALRSGEPTPLPGIDPEDFLETWLEQGTGGTCWPSCNALYAVAAACGFDATRATASMGDMSQANHGTIVVHLEGRDYLVDSSMLLNRAVPFAPGEPAIDDDPLKPVEYETVDGVVRFWFEYLQIRGWGSLPCRLLRRDVAESVFRESYEPSRTVGPFNNLLFGTRNFPDRIVTLHGRWEMIRSVDGTVTTTEHDAGSLRVALTASLGLAPAFVDRWAASGALDASLVDTPPPQGPPTSEVAPSRRR